MAPVTCPPTSLSFGAVLPCSSTTRPTGFDLHPGRVIYEVDTFRTLEWDGTGWIIMAEPAQTWAPTLTNITIGNGSVSVKTYHRCDGWCDFTLRVDLGSTSVMGTDPQISLPVAMVTANPEETWPVLLYHSSAGLPTGYFQGHTGGFSSSSFRIVALAVSGASITSATVTATVPFTWANGDGILLSGRYPMITRYS